MHPKTRSFSIRPYQMEDLFEVYAAADESREHVSKWMGWMTPDYSLNDARNWVEHAVESWQSGDSYEFLIIDSEDQSITGSCGLNSLSKKDRFCNLGYWVRASRLGHGAARQATLALRDFGFNVLKMNRLEIVVAEGNSFSRQVAESVGARYEGLLHKRLINGPLVYDAHMYALLREDSVN
jgi:ribosomal-protein-serine acetyltransferase